MSDLSRWAKQKNAGEKRDAEDPAAVARSLQAKRTKASTKRTYLSKVKTMTAWLIAHYPDTIDDTTSHMHVPLPTDAVLEPFLVISCSAFGFMYLGYHSALVDVYRANFLELEPRLVTELRRVLEGYEKTINSLKLRGLMKINEGEASTKVKRI
ncbi:hypothetical protein ON010_g7096 [Phytophthora cinnamomi]|nr:hypothetical protein ON010_g7096 [Phytophthora cinnamomi]